MTMSNNLKGMTAGLIATLALTAVMSLKSSYGLWPEVNFITLLISLGSISPVQAWMDHFIIGVVVWGLVYSAVDALWDTAPYWLKGIVVGVAAWLLMMVAFMPLAKAGLFGQKLGPPGALVSLGYHLFYGLVLGICYGLIGMLATRMSASKSSPQS
jgi:hypothetical protein